MAFYLLSVLFTLATVIAARVILGPRGNPFLLAFSGAQIAFFYGLPERLYSQGSGTEALLVAHLLVFTYFMAILLIASRGSGRHAMKSAASIVSFPTRTVVWICLAWLALKAYLVLRHGPAALAFTRGKFGAGDPLPLSLLETTATSVMGLLVAGLLAVLVVQHALGHRIKGMVGAIAAATLLLYVTTNESPVGTRRFLLILGLVWLAARWAAIRDRVPRGIMTRLGPLLLAAGIVGGASLYYQEIRNNLHDEEIAIDLTSGDPKRFFGGMVKYLTPRPRAEGEERPRFLRSGPLDFLVRVVDGAINEGQTTHGRATELSLLLVVPRVLFPGEKPTGDVDEVLQSLSIYPSRPFGVLDYPTSLAAIGMADFGAIGVLVVGALVGVLFRIYLVILPALKPLPLLYLAVVSALVQLAASQETSLTALLVTARDIFILALVYVPVALLLRLAKNPARLLALPRAATLSRHL